jgi:hypothetical protein
MSYEPIILKLYSTRSIYFCFQFLDAYEQQNLYILRTLIFLFVLMV